MDDKNELEQDDSAEQDEAKPLEPLDSKPVDDDTDAIQSALTNDFDVDAALASLSSLGDAIAEHENPDDIHDITQDDDEDDSDLTPVPMQQRESVTTQSYFPRPPMTRLQRGQMGSVIPAIVLIAVGAWWTFALTTSETPPATGTVALVLVGALGVVMLGYWFSSRRWAQGAFFGGVTLITSAGVLLYFTQTDNFDAYPLLLLAPGIGFLLTALLSQVRSALMGFTGVALILAGLAGLAVTTGTIAIDAETDNLAPILLPVIIGVLVILVVLPVIFKRRA